MTITSLCRFRRDYVVNASQDDPVVTHALTTKRDRFTFSERRFRRGLCLYCIGIKNYGADLPACRSGHFGAQDGGKGVVGVPSTSAETTRPIYCLTKTFYWQHCGFLLTDRDFPRFLAWEENGDLALDKMVTERFSIDQINEAADALANGKIAGRAILEF